LRGILAGDVGGECAKIGDTHIVKAQSSESE
jgi:hypothetical protein